ncbi:uncharacterized protein J5F26_013617 isoform 3-T5 [Ciconia maguari]
MHRRVEDSQATGVTEEEGRREEKEVSELANSSGSAESESCAERQPPPFRRGRPFFCQESARQTERIRSGLQVHGLEKPYCDPSVRTKSCQGQRRDVDKTGQMGVASACFPGFPKKR